MSHRIYIGSTTAPAAGIIGERLTSSVTSVALTSNTETTITSITLTPGVWDVSGIASCTATGGTAVAQAFKVGISTTNNAQSGTLGQDIFQYNIPNISIGSGSVPVVRAVVTSNTTYYLVCLAVYTSTTCPANGRISAVRVG